jgi:hypothetical protein
MSDALIFSLVFGGLVVARIIAATVIFAWILPRGTRCPNCDAETLRLMNGGIDRLAPWLRKSWCYECEWQGMLRVTCTPLPHPAAARPQSDTVARNA